MPAGDKVERNSEATGRRAGLARYRWMLVAVIASVLVLAAVLAALNSAVSRKISRVQDRISEAKRQSAGEADIGGADFERYLADGTRGGHVIDGPALHRFIELRYGSRIPDSVGPWRIVLHDGLADVEGVVDLERYLQQVGMEQPASLGSIVGQEIPFGFSGRLEAENGRGRFVIEEVTLLGLPLPLELVERVGDGNSGSSVLIQQFALPGDISGARIVGDKVEIYGGHPQ